MSIILNSAEIQSSAWQKVEAIYKPLLIKLRARLENPHIEEKERVELAWRIYEIKNLLAMAEPPKNVTGAG